MANAATEAIVPGRKKRGTFVQKLPSIFLPDGRARGSQL